MIHLTSPMFIRVGMLMALFTLPDTLIRNPSPVWAEDSPQVFSQRELDQLLAPIALYPDALLSQILMASTYPLEVVQASRWSKARGLKGEEAVKAAADQDWDPSVTSLCAFPHVLAMMNDKLEWTERLGDAFLGQQAQVMDTVQALRHKASEAGHLTSNDRIIVTSEGKVIVIAYANPEVIYVPYYDPYWAYGPWWWPAYPPYYWEPWPGYAYSSGVRAGFVWGAGYSFRVGFFFGSFDWYRRSPRVIYLHHYQYYYPRSAVTVQANVWVHAPAHRRGVAYRHAAVRERFSRSPGSSRKGRGRSIAPERMREPSGSGRTRDLFDRSDKHPEERTGEKRKSWREREAGRDASPSEIAPQGKRPAKGKKKRGDRSGK